MVRAMCCRRMFRSMVLVLACQWQLCLAVGDSAELQNQQAHNNQLIVLTYHDVIADVSKDPYATSRSAFVSHMDYLQSHGYRPVSLPFLEKVYNKQASLPPKAVLLTFDDGLKSYAEFVAPVLQTYHYPSVLSVVTAWLDGKDLPREYAGKLLDWDELRTLKQSPLITIVSHTHDLHHGVRSNPQDNEAAAAITRLYSPQSGHYETEAQFRQRIATDLKNTVQRFKRELHEAPMAITWPYGKYDGVLMEEASALGMTFQLTLDEGPATVEKLPRLNRIMMGNYNPGDFAAELSFQRVLNARDYFAEIRLDPFAGQTPEIQNKLLSSLLDNLERLKVNAVLIHPFDRARKKAFFANGQVDVAADILNRVAHQINTRLNVRRIYLALPDGNNALLAPAVLTDLSRLVWFNGVVFHGQSKAQIKSIKAITAYYHPAIRFGEYATATENAGSTVAFDFRIMPVQASVDEATMRQQLLASKGVPGKVLVSITLPDRGRRVLENLFSLLNSLGIRHYGFAYDKNLYGLKQDSGVAQERAQDAVAVFGG